MSFAPSIPFSSKSAAPMATPSEMSREMSGENITQLWGEQIPDFLRSVHPCGTAKLVWRDLRGQVSVRTIEKWLDGSSTPSLAHFAALTRVYPDIVGVLLPWVTSDGYAARLATSAERRKRAAEVLRGCE